MGIKVLDSFSKSISELTDWTQNSSVIKINFPDMTHEILEGILAKHGYENPDTTFQKMKLEFARLLATQGTYNF